MITIEKTGHIYYGSPIESSSKCGTCDGARCQSCKDVYVYAGKTHTTKEEAVSAENAVSILLEGTGIDVYDFYPQYLHLDQDEDLAISVWAYRANPTNHISVKTNPKSVLYESLWLQAVEGRSRWDKCRCTDKETPDGCGIGRTCCDSRCWSETKTRGRTERKWYM